MACAVMLAGLSAAFVVSLHRGAFGDPTNAKISFDLSQASSGYGHWVAKLPDAPFTIDTALRGAKGAYAVVVGDCRAVEREAAVVFSTPGHCTSAIQRGGGGIGGGTVKSLSVAGRTIDIPPTGLTPRVTWDLKFPLREAPWITMVHSGQVTYWVSRNDGSYQAVLAQLVHRFPGLTIEAGLKDPQQYAAYRQQIGTIRAAATLGVWLSVCAFLLAALESRWDRARSVSALAALGTKGRVLRIANLVEFAFPVLVAAIPSAAVAVLGGWAVLSFPGKQRNVLV